MLIVESKNGSFLLNDFKVYYDASAAMLNGETPYGQAFGLSSGYFKYSPATLVLFAPYTLFSFEVAKLIHYLVISILFFVLVRKSYGLTNLYKENFGKPSQPAFMILMLILSLVHLTRELHMGNINLLLILLSLVAIQQTHAGKTTGAALLYGLLFLVKPYFGLLIFPLVIRHEWRLLVKTGIAMLAISMLPVLLTGWSSTIELHKDWLLAMKSHSTDMVSEHTFSSIVYSYTGIKLAPIWQLVFIGAICLSFIAFRWSSFRKENAYETFHFVSDSLILMALIPNLVITDSQHFLFSIPMLGLILLHLFERFHWGLTILFVVLFFFYGANANDLLGNPLSDAFDRFSTIGVANLGLILMLLALRWKRLEKP